jgi:hypothetical protein
MRRRYTEAEFIALETSGWGAQRRRWSKTIAIVKGLDRARARKRRRDLAKGHAPAPCFAGVEGVRVRGSWHRAFGRFGFLDTDDAERVDALKSGAPEIAADRGLTRAEWRKAVNGAKRYRKWHRGAGR